MPVQGAGHAATTLQSPQPSQMESRGSARLLEEPPTQRIYPRNDAPVTLHVPASREMKSVDKRSLDYLLRTGFAGGLAGCAVRSPILMLILIHSLTATMLTRVTGQNSCRAPRSSQDPFPSVEPSVCQIYRKLVRRGHGDEGHQ
jgi:hypothetical protein